MQLDLASSLGQCFWIGLNGTDVHDSETQKILSTFQPGGFCLFKRNIKSTAQVSKFLSALKKNVSIPPFLAVDQEGGTVERLNEIIGTIPPAMALSASGSVSLAKKLHLAHAQILSALGFNVNFNPVLDLAVGTAGNGLGTRCFNDDVESITRYAKSIIEAYKLEGILACGKHFPGLGDTNLDSHLELPRVPRPWKKILREDLRPYKNLLSQLPFIMVNHALYPEMNSKLPASLAPEIVKKLLLETWKYKGLSISDDLMMGAVAHSWSLADSAELALKAGNHLFLICSPGGVVDAFDELLKRAKKNPELAKIISDHATKILAFKQKDLNQQNKKQSLGAPKSKMDSLSKAISDRAITKLSGEKLPRNVQSWSLFVPKTKWIQKPGTALAQWMRKHGYLLAEHLYNIEMSVEDAQQLTSKSNTEWNLVLVTGISNRAGQKALIQELVSKGKRVVMIHGSYPLDVVPQEVEFAIATYWTAPAALNAAAEVLFGRLKIRGVLPFLKKF